MQMRLWRLGWWEYVVGIITAVVFVVVVVVVFCFAFADFVIIAFAVADVASAYRVCLIRC